MTTTIMTTTNNAIRRTLICIVSYEAENEIESVLKRIPAEIWDSEEYHVLLSDDASKDKTVEKAIGAFMQLGKNNTILKLNKNQGYGGNQKICYRFAIEHDYDFVVLLHGDGQYDPELVTVFINYFYEKQVDVVLGSRMMKLKEARKGGMPYYKLIGNVILTKIQNYICNRNLSEYHTGYRAYTTKFLKKIPFELNSNDFHFDTEILLQSFHYQCKIFEFLIPTYYGDEICRVSGLNYAWKVLLSTFAYRLQKMGLLVSLKYPHSGREIYQDKTDDPNSTHYSGREIYQDKTDDPNSTHCIALNYLQKQAKLSSGYRLLDIGCGSGHIAKKLNSYAVESTGIDLFPPKVQEFHQFFQMDLEKEQWRLDITEFNSVLLLDVIEHLSNPELFLLSLRNQMKKESIPNVIISVPNVGFVTIRLNLLLGRFNYADRGILDISHKRFFTINSFKKILTETGFDIQNIYGVGVPFQTLGKSRLFRLLGRISSFMAKACPALFAFQILAVTQPQSTTYQLIKDSILSREHSHCN
jgi:glycosyltransferase involved in cell wall biosynthesis/2-polyprenyl-3-methyl-5-hydroxy-6-metoxy-1,4-benzoquinol methylase